MRIIYEYECNCPDNCGHKMKIYERDSDGRVALELYDEEDSRVISLDRDNLEHMLITIRMCLHQTDNSKNGKPIPILCPKCSLPISLNYENHCECSG